MASLALSVVVRVENVPWSANAIDIRKFFSGITIPEGGVHIIGGERGLAYVGFPNDDDATRAMQLNGSLINNCQVNLQRSSRDELAEMVSKIRSGTLNMAAQLYPKSIRVPFLASNHLPFGKDKENVQFAIRGGDGKIQKLHNRKTNTMPMYSDKTQAEWFIELRNLPSGVSVVDVSEFVGKETTIFDDDVIIVPWMERALVRFVGSFALKETILKMNGQEIGANAVEIVEVTSKEFAMAKEATKDVDESEDMEAEPEEVPEEPPGISKSPPQLPTVNTEYIKLSGLPVQYQWHNVRALFPSARIVKDGLKLEKNVNAQFTGVAFLKFASCLECTKALERLCNMPYTVTLLDREEYESSVASADGRALSSELVYNPNTCYVLVRNVEDGTTASDVCHIFTGIDINPGTDIVFRPGTQSVIVRLKSESEQQMALRKNRSLLGINTVTVEPASYGDFEQALGQAVFPQVGQRGCSVMLQNMNSATSQDDVLSIVEPFKPLADTLRMHYDDSGRATGRAIISFSSMDAAMYACAQLNGKLYGGQIILATVF